MSALPTRSRDGAAKNYAIVLGTPAAIRYVQEATSTIPIIMGFSTDPVGNGFVASHSHPGGNTTGLASLPTTPLQSNWIY